MAVGSSLYPHFKNCSHKLWMHLITSSESAQPPVSRANSHMLQPFCCSSALLLRCCHFKDSDIWNGIEKICNSYKFFPYSSVYTSSHLHMVNLPCSWYLTSWTTPKNVWQQHGPNSSNQSRLTPWQRKLNDGSKLRTPSHSNNRSYSDALSLIIDEPL